MVRFGHVALLAALGCSPVKDFSNVPDASIDGPDMRPAEIASSVPENGATKVSVLTPISVFFDEHLDPASVDATTVKLSYRKWPVSFYLEGNYIGRYEGAGQAGRTYVKGTVSYDDHARKVSFVPAAPLPYGRELTLTLDVKDRAGLSTSTSVTFTTFVNGNTKQFFFTGSTGAPFEWSAMPTDESGRITKLTRGNEAGPDGIWFTADDPRSMHEGFRYSPDGRVLEERYYDPGQDGRWDTADDIVTECLWRSYSPQNTLTEVVHSLGAGPDGMWCTNDDVLVNLQVYKYTADQLDAMIWYWSAGTDSTWRTPDDRCELLWDYTNDDRGNRVREVQRYCGTDGLPNTADDIISQYYEHEYDVDGNVTRSVRKTGRGDDGEWLTDDDYISQAARYVYDADGQLIEAFSSLGPGNDGMWGTEDDIGTRISYKYNAQKLLEELTAYTGFGNDGMWGTEDDVMSVYARITYDANGNRTRQRFYNSGPDGMLKTEDDRVTAEYLFDLDR